MNYQPQRATFFKRSGSKRSGRTWLSARVSRTVLFTLLVTLAQVSLSQNIHLPDEVVTRLIEQAQETFWRTARERQDEGLSLPAHLAAPILPPEDAKRVVYYAVPTGLAIWCGIEWQPHYRDFIRRERRLELWTETQLAFVESLFGLSQGLVAKAMDAKPCTAQERTLVAEELR